MGFGAVPSGVQAQSLVRATSSTIFAKSSTLRLLFVPSAERTPEWHTFFKWQWRHCVCGGLSSGTR